MAKRWGLQDTRKAIARGKHVQVLVYKHQYNEFSFDTKYELYVDGNLIENRTMQAAHLNEHNPEIADCGITPDGFYQVTSYTVNA